MKFYLFFAVFITFFVSLFSCTPKSYTSHAYRLINKFSENVDDGLQPFGVGGHFFEKINEFSLDYTAYKNEMDIEEARKILVHSAELLFCIVNEDEDVRPFLRYYPYTEKHFYLSLTFRDTKFDLIPLPNIGRVSLAKSEILYSNGGGLAYELIFKEPYSDAYEKVYGIPFPEERRNAE